MNEEKKTNMQNNENKTAKELYDSPKFWIMDIDMEKIMQSQLGYGIGHEDMPCACSFSSDMTVRDGQEIAYETPWIDIIELTDETDPGNEKYKKIYDEANRKFLNRNGCDI